MAGLIDYGIIKPELTNAFATGYAGAEKTRNSLLEQQQQRQLSDLQLQNALSQQQNAATEQQAWKEAGGDPAKARELLMQRGMGTQAMAVGTQMQTQQTAKLAQLKASGELMKAVTTRIMNNPDPVAARNAVIQFGKQTGTDVTADLQELDSLGSNPESIRDWATGHSLSADKMLSKFQPMSVAAGSSVYDPRTKTFNTAPERTDTDLIRNYNAAKGQGFTGSLFDYQQQIAKAGRAPAAERAPRTQQVTLSDGSLGIINMDTGAITPAAVGGKIAKGKLSAFAEKTAEQKQQLGKNVDQAIFELTKAIEPKGLIDQSTGSGIGRAYDVSAGFFGNAPEGAIAAGKLAPIADLVLKMVPRFEGPQSDKDTQSYKEAAGQLANSSLPRTIRKEAAKEILRLFKNRKNQFGTGDMTSEGTAPSTPAIAPPAGFTPD